MASKLARTTTPGIYRRHAKDCDRTGRCDCPYVVVHGGTAKTFRTMDEAREGKRLVQRAAKLSNGHAAGLHRDQPRDECPDCTAERAERERSAPLLHGFALEWVERYQGTGKRGFREETRAEYRALLRTYALAYFPADTRLTDVGPSEIAGFIGWLTRRPNGRQGTLSDKTVRNGLGPLRACLASAKREGKIRENPVLAAALPHRPQIEEDEELPRPFPRVDGEETMELVVSLVHSDHRLMFELLAATGLRRSELLAINVRHLALDGARPHVKVRQRTRWRKGQGQVIGPLKSSHARRELPISFGLADELREAVAGRDADELVFGGPTGRPYDPHHLHLRILGPACAEAGVEWAGFHTFRHTVASRMFASGRTAVQVQHWLGHHSAAFTLQTYIHLLDPDDLGGPLEPVRVKKRSSERPETAANVELVDLAETGGSQG
jgi:integrase